MKRISYLLFALGLALSYPATLAWGQGAHGERQFYNQLNSVRNQVRPHFKQARGAMADLRRQGVNTSGWERQLNYVESQLNNMRWQGGGTGGRSGTGFQTINPFGDYLFHGVPIRSKDGKLVTRHLDPDGLAARAEEWARELRDFNKDLSGRQGAEKQKYLSDINEKLTQLAAITHERLQLASLGGGQPLQPQTQELKPQTLGEELAVASLPKLEGDTPALLRDPFGREDPMITTVPRPGTDGMDAPPSTEVDLDKPVPLLRSEPGPDAPISMPWGGITIEQLDSRNATLAQLHQSLDMAGFIPGGGTMADLLNAGIYAVEGDWRNAGFASLAAVPLFGDFAAARKFARVGAGTSYVTMNLDEMGQLTGRQYAALLRLSESSGVKFGIAGGHAENALGLANRAQLQVPADLKNPVLMWRGGPLSQLSDVDLWFERGTDLKTIQRIRDEIKTIFPGKPVDLKYSLYYRTEKDLDRAGAIVFERGDSRRISSYWQKPNFNWPMDSPTSIGGNPQSGRIPTGIVIGPGSGPVSEVELITPWMNQ
jgi:hypothetical protein